MRTLAPALLLTVFAAQVAFGAPGAASASDAAKAPASAPAPASTSAAAVAPDASAERTAAGTSYVLPPDWTSTVRGGATMLRPPEGDFLVAVVDVGKQSDAGAAAAAAWAAIGSSEAWTGGIEAQDAPTEGWEERRVYTVERPAAAHALRQLAASRRGDAWTVLVIDGSFATFEKRASAIRQISTSVRPAGYVRESFVGRKPHRFDAARIAALEAFIRDAQTRLGVPGVGLAIVEGERIVHEGGLGVRELATRAPVGAHTRFMIASNTKGMTTLLLAKLVDEGKLHWDDPVVSVEPRFRLADPELTRRIRVRDMVCACTGVPRNDIVVSLTMTPDTPADQNYAWLAGLAPTSRFGEVFQYNNLMAAVAGYVGAHVAYPTLEIGAAYDRAMRERIFGPLGMADTSFDWAEVMRADHATPYSSWPGSALEPVDLAFLRPRAGRPAGGAWSSAHDVALYARNELLLGRVPGRARLMSAANVLARREPRIAMGEDGFYGMGLSGQRIGGVLGIQHGGSLPGFMSNFIVIPDANVAVVLLTNADAGQFMLQPFVRRVFELVYDGEPHAEAQLSAAAATKAAFEQQFQVYSRTPPGEVAAALADRYRSPELGTLDVVREGGGVVFRLAAFDLRVAAKPQPDGSVAWLTASPGVVGLTFVAATKDGQRTLTIRDAQHEYVYTAVAR